MQEHAQSGSFFVEKKHASHRSPFHQPLLDSSLATRVTETIQLIAQRLYKPEQVMTAVEIAKTQAQGGYFWGGGSFGGFVDQALLYLSLTRAFPSQSWEEPMHAYIRLATQATQQIPLTKPALFGGSSGLGSTMFLLSRLDARYQKVNRRLANQTAIQVLEASWHRETPGVRASDYDLISGAAGILGYLLSVASEDDQVQEAISKLLSYLVWLGRNENNQGRRHWFIPPEYFPAPHFYKDYPTGYFDVGLSHGIPGPLAALCLAWETGYRIEGQYETIKDVSQWLLEYQAPDEWGINWPGGVPLEIFSSSDANACLLATRSAWCYGAPGVAHSLLLAGRTLENESLRQMSLDAFDTALKRPTLFERTFSPSLCHGIGGLLIICLHFMDEMKSATLHQHCIMLVEKILELCDPTYLLGVRNEENRGTFVDDPGLLTGAAGVALALLASLAPETTDWDRNFLLS